MIGPKATLQDIVLELEPEVVDLMCHEELDSSEDEDEDAIHHQYYDVTPVEQGSQYRIVCDCYSCGNTLRLVVHSTEADVRVLEDLLMGTLEIVCPRCAGSV
ncbi:E7 [Macaca fascicularis papillomavirus 9]|uniref:Protein E7 n=1 Tax=Macaca fascicularis papillomavirus 9 TaxID=524652 RepID=C3RUD0_RHPV1|nr:E7 [Macaca fascicularis papillomavirus 9]